MSLLSVHWTDADSCLAWHHQGLYSPHALLPVILVPTERLNVLFEQATRCFSWCQSNGIHLFLVWTAALWFSRLVVYHIFYYFFLIYLFASVGNCFFFAELLPNNSDKKLCLCWCQNHSVKEMHRWFVGKVSEKQILLLHSIVVVCLSF